MNNKNPFEKISEAAGKLSTSVQKAAGDLGRAMPSADTLKRGAGRVLMTGGRILIDPKAFVGQIAVSVGANLAKSAASDEWLVVEASANELVVIDRGAEQHAKEVFERCVKEGKSVMLCNVRAAYSGL